MNRQLIALTALTVIAVAVAACAAPAAPAASPAQEGVLPEQGEDASPDGQDAGQLINTEKILEIGPDTPLCAIFPTLDGSGQQYTSRGTEDGDAIASGLGLSHGEVVFGTITDTIYDTMGLLPETDPTLITPDLYQGAVVILVVDNFQKPSAASAPVFPPMIAFYEGIDILIVGVDIGNFDTGQITHNIESAIGALVSNPASPAVNRFVINMSFALVPCNDELRVVFEDYRTEVNNNFPDLSMNLSALIAATYGSGHATAQGLTANRDFFAFTECLSGYMPVEGQDCGQVKFPGNTNIILVGAAGNSGYPFAFAPALWDHVVSVSASDNGGGKAGYSNTGEVMMDGTTKFSHGGVDVVGTSFASPRLALEQAFYLRNITSVSEGIECDGMAGIVARPPLGYIPEAGDWESGVTTDLPLGDARAQYCN